MERHGADHIVRKYSGSHAGIHRYSLRQLIATMGSGVLARRSMRPITALSAEALAVQVIEGAKLTYFDPVARTPGFGPFFGSCVHGRGEREHRAPALWGGNSGLAGRRNSY